jgi:phage terminase large subunit-like protein
MAQMTSTASSAEPLVTTAGVNLPEGTWFDEDAARRAIHFFERALVHVDGKWAGKPFNLQQWQIDQIIAPLYGYKRPNGTRHYRQAYIEVPRKAGKTTLCAGIALYGLIADGEEGAQVIAGARDRPQARLTFDLARRMVQASPYLRKMCVAKRSYIEVSKTGSTFRAISADAGSQHGLSVSTGILDELHVHKSRDVYDVIATSQGARTQPLLISITTAGVFDANSISWELHSLTESIAAGITHDPYFLGVLYGAEREDDWTSPETWRKAHPSLGETVSEEYLREECERAKAAPARQTSFKQLYLNVWTSEASRWVELEKWDECKADVEPEELRGEPCWIGLDLAATTDITALVAVFNRPDGEDGYVVVPKFFLPDEDIIERERRDRLPYRRWAEEGWLQLTPGNVLDYAAVRHEIHELAARYDIRELAYDRWGATALISQLQEDGMTQCVPTGQGFATMSAPAKELERLILGGMLRQDGSPVLRAHMDAVTVSTDAAGNIKPDKKKSTGRIDGVVALVMAVHAATLAGGAASTKSVYEDRGLETV